MKRQPIEWGKIFANHIPDISDKYKIYKELTQLNNNNSNNNKTRNQNISKKNEKGTQEKSKQHSAILCLERNFVIKLVSTKDIFTFSN